MPADRHESVARAATAFGSALSGATSALQAAVNGALAVAISSAPVAALVSFGTGSAILLTVTFASPRTRGRIVRLARAVRFGELAWWMLLGGVAGAFLVLAQTATVGVIGVAGFTVALIAGQMVSGLAVDMIGLYGVARRAPSVARVLGAGLAVLALAVAGSAMPEAGLAAMLLLALPFCAGLLRGWQQSANARVRSVAGSATLAATLNFLVGTAALSLVVAVGGARSAAPGSSGPVEWWMLIGGALGIVLVTMSTVAVPRIGVLLFGLLTVVGQLWCALALTAAGSGGPSAWRLVLAVVLGTVAAGVAAVRPARRT